MANSINIEINSSQVLSQLREIGQDKQGPFILSRSLNLLAKQVQANLRGMEEQTLTLRRRQWVLQQTKIEREAWSTKTKLMVVISLSEQAAFLSRMETGETKVSRRGKWLMVPNQEVFRNQVISADNPLNLHKLNFHTTPQGLRGTERTFMIKSNSTGEPLVLQRVGQDAKGKKGRGRRVVGATKGGRLIRSGLRLLYYGIKQAKIPKKMQWYNVATNTIQTNQFDVFTAVLQKALLDGKKR
jgi:hypothetical protein